MKRQIITIQEEKCNGCGICVPDCPEGALQIIDGKVRLIGDLYCDGLGACIGRCPEGAISIEEREAEDYNEMVVMENIVKQGNSVIKAHLHHLQSHGADTFYQQALAFLKQHNFNMDEFVSTPKTRPGINLAALQQKVHGDNHEAGCPGSRAHSFSPAATRTESATPDTVEASALSQWPIQMHLFNPRASHFTGADFLLAADCTAFSLGGFHGRLLAGKKLGIACPKLDSNREIYVDKVIALIDDARINTLTVVIMEVPCCSGLAAIAQEAVTRAKRKVPVKQIVVSIEGDLLSEEWL